MVVFVCVVSIKKIVKKNKWRQVREIIIRKPKQNKTIHKERKGEKRDHNNKHVCKLKPITT